MKRFSLRLEDEVHEKLRLESFTKGVSINDIITKAIEEYLQKDKEEE